MVLQRGRRSVRNTFSHLWSSKSPLQPNANENIRMIYDLCFFLCPEAELFLDFSGSNSVVYELSNLFVSTFMFYLFLLSFLFGLVSSSSSEGWQTELTRSCWQVPPGRPRKGCIRLSYGISLNIKKLPM